MLDETIPEPYLAFLAAHPDLDGQAVLFAAATDLSLAGRLADEWLVVTANHVAVIVGAGVRLCLPIAAVEKFQTAAVLGAGALQARIDGGWVDVLRYSNRLSPRFSTVAARLEAYRNEGTFTLRPEDAKNERCCPGCALTLAFAGDVCPRCLNRGAVLGRVTKLLQPYRVGMALMCVLIVLGVAAELAPPKLQQYLVDEVLQTDARGGQPRDLVAVLLVLVGGLACTRVVLALVNAAKGVLANHVGTAMTSELRVRLVGKLHELAVDYYDRHPVGVLMSRVSHDTEAIHGLIHQVTNGFLLQILQVVGVGIMLCTLNAELALWTLLPLPLVLYGSWFFWRSVYPRYYRYWDAAGKQAGALAGMLAGIRVVKAFAQEQREYERFQAASASLCRSRRGVEHSSAVFAAVMQLVFSLGGLIVWFVGGRDVLGNRMTLGALMAFLAYLAMFYAPLTTLAQLTTWLTSFLTAGQRVFELLDTPQRIRDASEPTLLPRMRGHVRFEGVTFGYDRHRPVLKDFSLEVHPGETLGVVGRSGSGKTTLVNLIARFYDVFDGRVTIDGCDVREIAREDLRRQIGVVLQEPFLFRGTIWENLVYGQPNAEPEAALAAARGANAHDFIMRLPLAYDTHLGERGAGLSGGEKQRLSIARTLLYDPQILLLDEATSSVDAESEKSIQDALAVLTRGRTTLAIAHRLSTLRNADRIIVMDNGRLVEEGSHEDLVARDAIYARLVRLQTQSAGTTVDSLLHVNGGLNRDDESAVLEEDERWKNPTEERPTVDAFTPRWLEPMKARLSRGPYDDLKLELDAEVYHGVFAVMALPATCPRQWISLRWSDADGQDQEIGMARDLADWPVEAQALIQESLARRSYIRRITAIESIELNYGLLTFVVQTDGGRAQFLMRNAHSQAQDFGRSGKLLIDVDDNCYLVKDDTSLPRRQHALFRRYIYW